MLDQSVIVHINGRKAVRKRYGEVRGLIKWVIAGFPLVQLLYPFDTDPWVRMAREFRFFSSPPKGVKVPKVLELDPKKIEIVREYVEGREISCNSLEDSSALGELLAIIHEAGYCLGDTKPSNFLISGDEIYVIDAEQATAECVEERYKLWDLLFHLFALSYARPNAPRETLNAYSEEFLHSYFSSRSRKFDYSSVKDVVGFFYVLSPHIPSKLRSLGYV